MMPHLKWYFEPFSPHQLKKNMSNLDPSDNICWVRAWKSCIKALTRLLECTGKSVHLVFTCNKIIFPPYETPLYGNATSPLYFQGSEKQPG